MRFHSSSGGRGRPVRRDFSYEITRDEDGNPINDFLGADVFGLSPEGSIDRKTCANKDRWFSCGHHADQPPGGCCGEPGCGRTSCAECFKDLVCRNCRKPLCGQHAKRLEISTGVFVTVCFDCSVTLKRRRILTAIGRVLARPFITFNKPEGA